MADADANSGSDSEVECDECECMINCTKEGVYILNKEANKEANEVANEEANEVANEVANDEELVWCQACFEELWQAAAEEGWRGDDIEERLKEE
jgi:hypothetical protein